MNVGNLYTTAAGDGFVYSYSYELSELYVVSGLE
jgi:hypothetical protein